MFGYLSVCYLLSQQSSTIKVCTVSFMYSAVLTAQVILPKCNKLSGQEEIWYCAVSVQVLLW